MSTFVITLLFSVNALAAGNSGHGGPGDLVFPAINLAILLGFLIFKLTKPANDMYKNKSSEIKEKIETAAVKAKEADMMMDMQKKKMQASDDEIKKLKAEADEIITRFESEYKADVDSRINKMKEDAGQKIETEKKELLDKLNASLLDQVIQKTKTTLRQDKGLSESAAKKILEGVK